MAWNSPRTWTTSEVVTATHMNEHVRDNFDAINPIDGVAGVTWSPTLTAATTNPDAPPTIEGGYWRVGPVVFAWFRFVFAASGPGTDGSGAWIVDLPVTASTSLVSAGATGGTAIGPWFLSDSGTSANSETGTVILAGTGSMRFRRTGASLVQGGSPFNVDTSDVFSGQVVYLAA